MSRFSNKLLDEIMKEMKNKYLYLLIVKVVYLFKSLFQ